MDYQGGYQGFYQEDYQGIFEGIIPPVLVRVHGESKKANGEVSSVPFYVRIKYGATEYSDEIQIRQEEDITVIPDESTGGWEVYLYDTEGMEAGSYYGFLFENRRVERKYVPRIAEISYNKLENA